MRGQFPSECSSRADMPTVAKKMAEEKYVGVYSVYTKLIKKTAAEKPQSSAYFKRTNRWETKKRK